MLYINCFGKINNNCLEVVWFKKIKLREIFFYIFSSRYFHWKLQLYVTLFVLIVLLPAYIAFFVLSNVRFGKWLVARSNLGMVLGS